MLEISSVFAKEKTLSRKKRQNPRKIREESEKTVSQADKKGSAKKKQKRKGAASTLLKQNASRQDGKRRITAMPYTPLSQIHAFLRQFLSARILFHAPFLRALLRKKAERATPSRPQGPVCRTGRAFSKRKAVCFLLRTLNANAIRFPYFSIFASTAPFALTGQKAPQMASVSFVSLFHVKHHKQKIFLPKRKPRCFSCSLFSCSEPRNIPQKVEKPRRCR